MREMIAFVPARSGSKRLKDKNQLKIEGISLIRRTLLLLCEGSFTHVVLSSDSKEYFNEAKGLNVHCDLRPLELSHDDALTSDLLVEWLERSKISKEAIIFLWQVTSPFRSDELVRDFVDRARLLKHGEMLMCVSKLSKVSEINDEGVTRPIDYSFGVRSQDVKSNLVKENGLGYAITMKTLLLERDLFPPRVISFPTNSYCLDLDIDDEIDFNIAKILLENGIQNRETLRRTKS
jgi:CMP-N,N'-diacetyllegionaminic acid synthase